MNLKGTGEQILKYILVYKNPFINSVFVYKLDKTDLFYSTPLQVDSHRHWHCLKQGTLIALLMLVLNRSVISKVSYLNKMFACY